MKKDDSEFEDINAEPPDTVKAALRTRFGPVPDVPSNIDQSILADARRHFEQHGPASLRPTRWRRVSKWQWTVLGSSVAAACVLFFAMKAQPPQNEQTFAARSVDESSDAELKSDVDLNGQVDILDAFAMARQIRSGQDMRYDINRDGRFDKLDIDIVAREAVKL